MTSSETVSFVVVTMNRCEELQRCLQSIVAQNGEKSEIIVVNNGDAKSVCALLAAHFPDVMLLQQVHNTGAAGGKNIGLKAAKGDYIICLDDDTAFTHHDVITKVGDYFAHHSSVGALSFNILDTATQATAARYIPRRDKCIPTGDALTGYFLGGGCAFRRAMLDKTGYYWEILNPYGAEEFDLSYRILDAGYDILWTQEIAITHVASNSGRSEQRHVYALARNHPLVALKNLPWLQVLSNYILWWGYAGLHALKSGKFSTWFAGVAASLQAIPSTLKLRKKISKAALRKLRQRNGPYWY
ncbi:MAG: glycosyltransferase [Alphaproteobacteria bacterium]|nr:glycosyltransferase [Alphaproteobacteria bacterium]